MSLITESQNIRRHLINRFEELSLRQVDIVNDSIKRKFAIAAPHLNNYLKGETSGIVSEKQIVWLCTRWGIFINILIGEPTLKNGIPGYEVGPYNELKCLSELDKGEWIKKVKQKAKLKPKKKRK